MRPLIVVLSLLLAAPCWAGPNAFELTNSYPVWQPDQYESEVLGVTTNPLVVAWMGPVLVGSGVEAAAPAAYWLWNDFSGATETARLADKSASARAGTLVSSAALNYVTYETGGASLSIPTSSDSLEYTVTAGDISLAAGRVTFRFYAQENLPEVRILAVRPAAGWSTDYMFVNLDSAGTSQWRFYIAGELDTSIALSAIPTSAGWHTLVLEWTSNSMTATLDGGSIGASSQTRTAASLDMTKVGIGSVDAGQTAVFYIDKFEFE